MKKKSDFFILEKINEHDIEKFMKGKGITFSYKRPNNNSINFLYTFSRIGEEKDIIEVTTDRNRFYIDKNTNILYMKEEYKKNIFFKFIKIKDIKINNFQNKILKELEKIQVLKNINKEINTQNNLLKFTAKNDVIGKYFYLNDDLILNSKLKKDEIIYKPSIDYYYEDVIDKEFNIYNNYFFNIHFGKNKIVALYSNINNKEYLSINFIYNDYDKRTLKFGKNIDKDSKEYIFNDYNDFKKNIGSILENGILTYVNKKLGEKFDNINDDLIKLIEIVDL